MRWLNLKALPRSICVLFVASFLSLLAGPLPIPAYAANCQFVLGFKTLHDLIPATVGDCLVDEHHNPTNGDGLQETTHGLLVWRKADNWTAFTDGYHTWINGPNGLQERLNTERFSWEADYPAGHTFYLSSYYTAHTYYCDDDPDWKSLSPNYLVHLPSEDAVHQQYPSYTLHQPC